MTSGMLTARTVEAGSASGRLRLLKEPISFWGDVDVQTGRIVAPRHPDYGVSLAGQIVLLPSVKGSSSSSSVIAELLRRGCAPRALLLPRADLIVALGAIVSRELYGLVLPIACLDQAEWHELVALQGDIEVQLNADDLGTTHIRWTEARSPIHEAQE